MEDEESLKASTHVSKLPDPVQHQVNDLLPNGVVPPGVVVGGVLLASDQLLRMKQLSVGSSSHLI